MVQKYQNPLAFAWAYSSGCILCNRSAQIKQPEYHHPWQRKLPEAPVPIVFPAALQLPASPDRTPRLSQALLIIDLGF
jgi:hypothetical protein